MRPRRAARRLLDPWAGLLFAALIVLAVMILLATPVPWRMVGAPEAPVTIAPAPPSDVAVFVLAGPAAARCSAVVWLHIEYEPAALTVTLVPAQTQCGVAGGGSAPVRRLVTDLDPQTAGDALGDTLGVSFDGWVTLDRLALVRLFAAARAPGDTRPGKLDFKGAVAAFSTSADDLDGLRRQWGALDCALRALRYGELTANAVVNYVLGSADVVTDLDLRAASTLVKAFRELGARDVAVGASAAIVERCGSARSWRLDQSRLEPLRLSLAFGLKAGSAAPRVAFRDRTAEVLVVAPAGLGGAPFAEDVRAALAEAGARPAGVHAVSLGGAGAARQLAGLIARRRPLAVVVVARVAGGEQPADAAGRVAAMAEALRAVEQPGVVVGESGRTRDELTDAVSQSGLPVVEVEDIPASSTCPPAPGTLFAFDEARRAAARLVAAAVGRACWPEYLAPALPGTRLEFSYAARHATTVALVGVARNGLAEWLAACGFKLLAGSGSGWNTPAAPRIVHLPGARRAALALAGDIGWGAGTLVVDPSAPAEVTVVGASE